MQMPVTGHKVPSSDAQAQTHASPRMPGVPSTTRMMHGPVSVAARRLVLLPLLFDQVEGALGWHRQPMRQLQGVSQKAAQGQSTSGTLGAQGQAGFTTDSVKDDGGSSSVVTSAPGPSSLDGSAPTGAPLEQDETPYYSSEYDCDLPGYR